jgi:hypothetical protein
MRDRITLPKSIDENATIDDLRFIFSQAKDRISVLTEDAERLYQRSVIIITICITSVTAIIGYVGSHLEFSFATVLLSIIGAVMWVVLSMLKPNMVPQDYWGIGSQPVTLATDAFFTDLEGDKAEWHLLYSEIISYQWRIEENVDQNEKRAKNLKDAITCIYWIPLIAIVILALFVILDAL